MQAACDGKEHGAHYNLGHVVNRLEGMLKRNLRRLEKTLGEDDVGALI